MKYLKPIHTVSCVHSVWGQLNGWAGGVDCYQVAALPHYLRSIYIDFLVIITLYFLHPFQWKSRSLIGLEILEFFKGNSIWHIVGLTYLICEVSSYTASRVWINWLEIPWSDVIWRLVQSKESTAAPISKREIVELIAKKRAQIEITALSSKTNKFCDCKNLTENHNAELLFLKKPNSALQYLRIQGIAWSFYATIFFPWKLLKR